MRMHLKVWMHPKNGWLGIHWNTWDPMVSMACLIIFSLLKAYCFEFWCGETLDIVWPEAPLQISPHHPQMNPTNYGWFWHAVYVNSAGLCLFFNWPANAPFSKSYDDSIPPFELLHAGISHIQLSLHCILCCNERGCVVWQHCTCLGIYVFCSYTVFF